jgi:hypothetical protein
MGACSNREHCKIVNYGITIAFMSQAAVRLCNDVTYRYNVKVQTTAQIKRREQRQKQIKENKLNIKI